MPPESLGVSVLKEVLSTYRELAIAMIASLAVNPLFCSASARLKFTILLLNKSSLILQ
ncbi:hypothetical protein D3C78_1973650 [compost metagenome]